MSSGFDAGHFEVVALGCNARAEERLAKVLRKYGIETFQFVEYFFVSPLTKEAVGDNWEVRTEVFFPFLSRLVEKSYPFLPTGPVDQGAVLKLEPRVRGALDEHVVVARTPVPAASLPLAPPVVADWKSDGRARLEKRAYSKERLSELIHPKGDLKDSAASKAYHLSFNFLVRPWLACAQLPSIWTYPIASDRVCYGYFLLEHVDVGVEDERRALARELEVAVKSLSDEVYRPTLVILHNSMMEHRVADVASDRKKVAAEIQAALVCGRSWELSNDRLESAFGKLWKRRSEMLNSGRYRKVCSVDHTLQLHKYSFASPGMVAELKKLIDAAPSLVAPTKAGDPLPTALICGAAGAGKDTMAKLVPVFTQLPATTDPSGYCGLKPRTTNLGALRPNSLVSLMLLGLDGRKIAVLGKELPGTFSAGGADGQEVLVLDELNSMDGDLQGILLRVLENGEVSQIFGEDPIRVKHLVIGVMNEDPVVLGKERELQDLKAAEGLLGTLVASFLYEGLSRARRLRPDVRYRLSRGLFVNIPALDKRREDIPILFYFECCKACRELTAGTAVGRASDRCQLVVDLRSYEHLMKPDLSWPGNVRQLQSVARKVARMTIDRGPEPKVHHEDVVLAVEEVQADQNLGTGDRYAGPSARHGDE